MAFDLGAKFPEAIGFYVIILAATTIGFAMGFLPINPIQLLVWTAVINEIVAVPIMAVMMLIVTNRKAMGRFQALNINFFQHHKSSISLFLLSQFINFTSN